jgi:hypothetical protein
LDREELTGMERMGEKSAAKLVAAIEKSKGTTGGRTGQGARPNGGEVIWILS